MSAPGTVLMSADPLGGAFSSTLDLCRALARREVRVVLAVLGTPAAAPRAAVDEAREWAEVHEGPYRLAWLADPWEDVARAGEWLLRLEERARPDVVHLDGAVHGALPFRAPRLVSVHGCLLSWFEAAYGRPAPSRFDRYRREMTAGLGAAHAVVTPTRAVLDLIVRRYGLPVRASVIPPGRDPRRFRPVAKEEMVLTLGRLWDPAENLGALAAVAPSLGWPVRAGGSDVAPDGERRDLPGVERLGVLSPAEEASLLSRAAVYAAPARHDAEGTSILEAALSGCALVLGDVPGLRELWGGAALFVDPDDVDDLGRALRCLAQHPAVRTALGARSRARALECSPDRTALAVLGLHAELLGRSVRSDPPRRLPSVRPALGQ
jgi:glycosyltransferase involved in cell wall biosynthesis